MFFVSFIREGMFNLTDDYEQQHFFRLFGSFSTETSHKSREFPETSLRQNASEFTAKTIITFEWFFCQTD